jgi:hypothetical protein
LVVASVGLALTMIDALTAHQQKPDVNAPIPFSRGQVVAPLYEGWYRDPSGQLLLSFGYLNRNFEEELTIPIGPANRIEPGPPDQGQPTHFVPRRAWGAFTVLVPKDLEKKLVAEKKTVTWTLTSQGQTTTIGANLGPQYNLNAEEGTSSGGPAGAPLIRFDPSGPSGVGPKGISTTLKTVHPKPVTIDLWVTNRGGRAGAGPSKSPVSMTWSKYRGPGAVKITGSEPPFDLKTGKATATATFAQPGEYVLRLEAQALPNHDFQCCWTNAYVRVIVSPAGQSQ